MVSGETILKITDYPFAYSFVSIVVGFFGINIFVDNLFFIAIAGFLGTALTIIDPIGNRVKKGIKKTIREKYNSPDISGEKKLEYESIISAIDSRSINFEVDKIVNFIYFALIIATFGVVVGTSDSFVNHLLSQIYGDVEVSEDNICIIISGDNMCTITKNSSKTAPDNTKIACDFDCIRGLGLTSSVLLLVILIYVARPKKKELDESVELTGYYGYCVNSNISNLVQIVSLEKLGNAITENNWRVAKWWKTKIESEVENETVLQKNRSERKQIHIEKLIDLFHKKLNVWRDGSGNIVSTPTHQLFGTATSLDSLSNFDLKDELLSHFSTDSKFQKIPILLKMHDILQKEIPILKTDVESFGQSEINNIMTMMTARSWKKYSKYMKNNITKEIIYHEEIIDKLLDRIRSPNWTRVTSSQDSHGFHVVEYIHNKIIGKLSRTNAESFTNMINTLADNIRFFDSQILNLEGRANQIDKEVKDMLIQLIDATSALGSPLSGICKICATEQFHSISEIQAYKNTTV